MNIENFPENRITITQKPKWTNQNEKIEIMGQMNELDKQAKWFKIS